VLSSHHVAVTGSATPTARRFHDRVRLVVRMPFRTVRLLGVASASDVLEMRHGFQVIGIHAGSIAAEMVEF
jgi:hypothetical protein